MKSFGILIAGIVGTVVLYAGLSFAGTALHLFSLPFIKFADKVQTNEDIIHKTYNADNALYNYHWFQETYGDIQATKTKIGQAKDDLASYEQSAGPRPWDYATTTEDSRLRSVVTGLQQHLESTTAEYNAKAGEADRTMFQNGLPLYVGLN